MSAQEVHPSAVGANVQPTNRQEPSSTSNTATTGHEEAPSQSSTSLNGSSSDDPLAPEGGYPEQKHAGAVGYGPNYSTSSTLSEKVVGLKEEVVGKVTKNHQKVEHGKELRTGELKRREREKDLSSSFGEPGAAEKDEATPAEKKEELKLGENDVDSKAPHANTLGDKGAKERAATVNPEGTELADRETDGRQMKHIG